MNNPRFAVGDQVRSLSLGAKGTVRAVINAGDPEDVRAQGYRYEVEFRSLGGQLWSLRERDLRPGQRRARENFEASV